MNEPTNHITKYTPPPWIITGSSGDGKRIFIEGQPQEWERCAIEVDSDDCCYETAEANARLVAAAPDLLESLQVLVSIAEFEGWDNATTGRQIALKSAKKAIVKATSGEAK